MDQRDKSTRDRHADNLRKVSAGRVTSAYLQTVLTVLPPLCLSALAIALSLPMSAQAFYATGSSASVAPSPHPTGWAAWGQPISLDQGIYNYNLLQFRYQQGQIVTDTTEQVAIKLRDIGPVTLYAVGGMGASVTSTKQGFAGTTSGLLTVGRGQFKAVIGYGLISSTILPGAKTLQLGLVWQPKVAPKPVPPPTALVP